nr:hypothetical protein 18 [bacterium]
MAERKKRETGISDGAIWAREYQRQLLGVKGALRSLQLQAEERTTKDGPTSKTVKSMTHTFEMVAIAFKALNTPKPEPKGEDYLPNPRGRREFLAELKGDDR